VNRAGLLLAGLLGLALLVFAVVATPPRGDPGLARLPSADSTGRPGMAAAARWLAATHRPFRRLAPGQDDPGPGETWLLLAPAAPLDEREVSALLDHADAGGLVVWALGPGGEAEQPTLARRLAARRIPGREERSVGPPADHPLFEGLTLRAGGAGVRAEVPGARPVLGETERPAAVAIPRGRGELLLLAGPELLDNGHVGEGDALSLWVRLAARGPLAFDERHLRRAAAGGRAGPPPGTALALQAALVVLLLAAALWPRLGAVRPPPAEAAGRTTRDYLASLAELYRRAGAEPELAAEAWRRVRSRLEARSGVGAALPAEVAARRIGARIPGAVEPLLRGEAALARGGPGLLLEVARAAADVEAAGRWRRGGGAGPETRMVGSTHVEPRR
jgi:hypothetical protein